MLPEEEVVMRELGLGQHFHWYNGSGSCAYIAQEAVRRIAEVFPKHDLPIDVAWIAKCREANEADRYDSPGGYSLTNTWVMVASAIRSALTVRNGGVADDPNAKWVTFQFFDKEARGRWEERRRPRMSTLGKILHDDYPQIGDEVSAALRTVTSFMPLSATGALPGFRGYTAIASGWHFTVGVLDADAQATAVRDATIVKVPDNVVREVVLKHKL